MSNRSFHILGWIVGIAAFYLLQNLLFSGVESLGITTYIDFGREVCTDTGGGPYSYEQCSDGRTTDISFGLLAFALLIAIGIGNMVYNRAIIPFSNSEKGKLLYFTALVCVLLWISTGIIILQLAGDSIGERINLGTLALIAYFGYKHYENKR